MKSKKIIPDLRRMERTRKEYLDKISRLSSLKFDPEKWEKLREIVYKPQPLDLDVIIDDCTLREGYQMAGIVTPRPDDTCRIARLLRDIGAERLEVLTYTKSDQEAIKKMQDEGLGDILAGWCRASRDDVDIALKLGFKQVGISHPVSHIHFKKWEDRSLQQLIDRVEDAVEYAVDHGLRVFVHGEDSTRASWDFEKIFINVVAEAGAEVYRVCDTIGCGRSDPNAPLPVGIPAKVKHIKEETKIPYVEFHGHDDLGNAVENTMATIRAASGLFDKVYASTTFLGIGDRSGNAETEKVIMNCYLHHGINKWNLKPMRELAQFIASSVKYRLPLNKAIVGDAAFAHESGIHVHGVMTLPLTYETFPPELVGQERTVRIGKRSGKHSIRIKLEEITGRKIDEGDPRFIKLVQMIKNKFVKGVRRYPIKEEEFKRYARKLGFNVKD